MEEIQRTRIQCASKDSSLYPARLQELSGMPKQLYYIGRFPDDDKPTAAIVGARLCSPYGRIQAFNYGKFLSEHGVQVISGMAAGIDAEGQQGCSGRWYPDLCRAGKMVWTSVILHPAEVFTGGSPKKTEGSSANMNQVPKAGHIIFRQGTGSSADWQIWCLWWKQKKRADH